MTMDNLAKEIIELGQNKQYDRLDTVIAQCETRRVSNLSLTQSNGLTVILPSLVKQSGRRDGGTQ